MPPTIWHPFTQMLTAEAPLKVASGSGVYLELSDGRKLVDCISSWWVNIHGHAHPQIAEAIYKQACKLEQVIFAGFTHQPAEDLAELLLEKLPADLQHFFFSDNGSTAVEVALKMAFQYFHNSGEIRPRFIAFQGGYHGDTVGSMSIGQGSPFWQKFEPLMFAVDLVKFPSTFDGDSDCPGKEAASLEEIDRLLSKSTNPCHSAICIEPLVQGAAGMRICRPEFLRKLRELADRYKVLLIFDEVMTGFGRTGDFFASTKSGVTPDIICLSKGITGGFMPLSLTVCRSEIYESFLDDAQNQKTFFHGHSYTANPLACAAAIASWRLLVENQALFQNMETTHRRLAKEALCQEIVKLKNIRFCGTIFAAELSSNKADGYFHELAPYLKKRFIEKGFLIRPLGNSIYLMPPYCISEEILENAYKAIADTLKELAMLTCNSAQ